MSDYDRGPYTPPSDRLALERREPVRSGGPAPVTLIVSGVILAAIIGGVVAVYHGGIRHRSGPPQTVGAPAPAADVNGAAPPAQLTVDRSDNSLGPAPPPAWPASAAAPGPLAAVAGPPPGAPAPTAPVVSPPPVTAPPSAAHVAPPAQPVALRPAATPAAAPATPAKPPKPLTIASIADAAIGPHHTPLRPALSADAASASPGGVWVQIGAFSSADLANKDWTQIAQFDARDMAGKGKQVQSTSHDGHTWYRTIVTGFSSEAAAQAFCGKLTAAHKPCIAH